MLSITLRLKARFSSVSGVLLSSNLIASSLLMANPNKPSQGDAMAAILNCKRYSMFEVARLLNVHVATIWRWHLGGVRGRKLPTVMVGGRRYVLATDLETFLASGSTAPPQNDAELRRRADVAGAQLDARRVKGTTLNRHTRKSTGAFGGHA
jgi:hypothetical protein